MSYHAQQNTQEKSVGIFIVFAFHVLLVWALANGLMVKIIPSTPAPPAKYFPIDPVAPPEPLPKVVDPVIQTSPIELTQPKPIEYVIPDESHVVPPVIPDNGGATGDGKVISGSSITKPTIRKATKPEYPAASTRLGEEGTTGLQLYIAADGRVTDAQVVRSSGSLRLDTAAVKHVIRSWAFNPCTEDGKAVACVHQTNLTWRLEDTAR